MGRIINSGNRGSKRISGSGSKVLDELEKMSLANFFMLAFAGIINAYSITMFLFPMKFFDGGLSGIAMLLAQATPKEYTLPFFLVLLNIPTIILALFFQGLSFAIYSSFAVATYSLSVFFLWHVLPIWSLTSEIGASDVLLCALFGGLISGIAKGVAIRYEGAVDGLYILSSVLSDKIGISPNVFVTGFNICFFFILTSITHSRVVPLYSMISYFVCSKAAHFIICGMSRFECITITTTKANELCDVLNKKNVPHKGLFIKPISFRGNYENAILIVVDYFKIAKIKHTVYEIDPQANIYVQDISCGSKVFME
jgi:uncharacterized membrane-anchored protein YitT (DUF2179 family)